MPDFETNAQFEAYGEILDEKPDAIAVIQGGSKYPDIRGEVWLYQLKSGVLVAAEVYGLSKQEGQCDSRIFGFHLHDGDSCMSSALIQPRDENMQNNAMPMPRNSNTQNNAMPMPRNSNTQNNATPMQNNGMTHSDAPFPLSGAHYNPGECEHPHHAGDLPPLFGCNGYAMSVFLTDRFLVDDVIGKTLIIHDRPDDFKTQPAGDAGEKMACGVIQSVLR